MPSARSPLSNSTDSLMPRVRVQLMKLARLSRAKKEPAAHQSAARTCDPRPFTAFSRYLISSVMRQQRQFSIRHALNGFAGSSNMARISASDFSMRLASLQSSAPLAAWGVRHCSSHRCREPICEMKVSSLIGVSNRAGSMGEAAP